MEDKEKSEMGVKTFIEFFKQFGDDIYSQILLEELLKGVINEEALFVFGEQIEERNETCDSLTEQIGDEIKVDEFEDLGSSNGMGEEYLSDYP